MIKDENTQRDFLLREYQETHNYFNNVERSMADLLRFYNSILAIMIPVSAVLFQYLKNDKNLLFWVMTALSVVVCLLGLYVFGMYIELRIRKIKTLEQIAIFREKMIEANQALSNILKMIPSISECPPYLRRPSSEWYTVSYISFVNGLVAAVASGFFIRTKFFQRIIDVFPDFVPKFLGIVLPILILVFFAKFLFKWATKYCFIYDLKREREYSVKNRYSFLDPSPYFPRLFWLAKWIAERYESKLQREYSTQERMLKVKEQVEGCEFCNCLQERHEVILENDHWFSKWDKYPVTKGHALIIPKVHRCDLFELSGEEFLSCTQIMISIWRIIVEKCSPDGFNVGVNIGKCAGQTIQHLHIHLIPRYCGDVPEPEGGVRNVIPGKGKPGA